MRRGLTITLGVLSAWLALASPVLSQSKGPNGGLLAGEKGHETELVIAPNEITVFILHGSKLESTKGTNARAVIQESGKNTTVALVDVGGSKLVGKLAAPLGPGAIVVITGKHADGHSISARYVIK